jgi:hypothetical protein
MTARRIGVHGRGGKHCYQTSKADGECFEFH